MPTALLRARLLTKLPTITLKLYLVKATHQKRAWMAVKHGRTSEGESAYYPRS